MEDEENTIFICADTKDELIIKNEIAGKIAMGDDADLTVDQIKDAHAYLDRFIQEIAYKRRFESNFTAFKVDILKHISEMQKGIDDLALSKPYLLVDHANLWTAMTTKFNDDKLMIWARKSTNQLKNLLS